MLICFIFLFFCHVFVFFCRVKIFLGVLCSITVHFHVYINSYLQGVSYLLLLVHSSVFWFLPSKPKRAYSGKMGLFGEEKVVYRPVDEFYVGPKSDHVYVRANVKGSTSSLYPFDPPLFLVSLSFFLLPLLICFRMILTINLSFWQISYVSFIQKHESK